MKTESNVKYVLRLALTLLLITAVVAALLAVVNQVTEPEIARIQEEKTQEAIKAVLKDGYDKELPVDPAAGIVSKVYQGPGGYAVEVKPVGFDNTITMMVGIDNDGKILGISIVSHTETAGLGAVAAANTAKGEEFRAQFKGLSGEVKVEKDNGEIDSITGATITSRAVCEGINAALAYVAGLG